MAENVKRIVLQVIWDGKQLTQGVKDSSSWLDRLKKGLSAVGSFFRRIQFQLLGVGFLFMTLSKSLRGFFTEGQEFIGISLRMASVVDTDLSNAIIDATLAWEELKFTILDALSPTLINFINYLTTEVIPAFEKFLDVPFVKEVLAWIIVFGGFAGIIGFIGTGMISLVSVVALSLSKIAESIIWFIANPVALLVLAVAAIAVAWITNFGDIRGKTIDVLALIGMGFMALVNAFQFGWDIINHQVIRPFIMFWKVAYVGFAFIWDSMVNIVKTAVDAILLGLQTLFAAFGEEEWAERMGRARGVIGLFFDGFKLGAEEAALDAIKFATETKNLTEIFDDFTARQEGYTAGIMDWATAAKEAAGAGAGFLPELFQGVGAGAGAGGAGGGLGAEAPYGGGGVVNNIGNFNVQLPGFSEGGSKAYIRDILADILGELDRQMAPDALKSYGNLTLGGS